MVTGSGLARIAVLVLYSQNKAVFQFPVPAISFTFICPLNPNLIRLYLKCLASTVSSGSNYYLYNSLRKIECYHFVFLMNHPTHLTYQSLI